MSTESSQNVCITKMKLCAVVDPRRSRSHPTHSAQNLKVHSLHNINGRLSGLKLAKKRKEKISQLQQQLQDLEEAFQESPARPHGHHRDAQEESHL